MATLSRILLSLAALAFVVLGLLFWTSTAEIAARFGCTSTSAAGLVNLRADMGGLFLALGLLCAAGAWLHRHAALRAATAVLVVIVLGRVLGWLVEGRSGIRVLELAFELIVIGALALALRQSHSELHAAEGGSRPLPKRFLAAAGVLGVALVTTLLNPSVQAAIFDRGAQHMTARVNAAPLADDGLRVAIAGSSAPLPSTSRAKACVVVFAGGKFWVVDSGPESVENLVLWGIPLAEIGGVLLTHFHSDHIGDLGELQLQTWAGGRPEPLRVYGGPGVERVVEGFNRAYELDQGYRTAHHGEEVMPSASWGLRPVSVELDGPPTPAKDRSAVVLDNGELRITALEVDHAPIEPAYAYRFDYKGRSAVVTGDLKYHPPLARGAAGVDLLVSEAISRTMTRSLEAAAHSAAHSAARGRTAAIMHDVQDYHISPEEAARLANDAGARHLAFYHLLPAPDGWLPRQLFARGVNEVRPSDWTIADDGTLYTLPLGSDEVRVGRIGG
jgi:ribonuclease Z